MLGGYYLGLEYFGISGSIGAVSPQSTAHAVLSDTIVLLQSSYIVAQNSNISVYSNNILWNSLLVDNCRNVLLVDDVLLRQLHNILVDNCKHGMSSSTIKRIYNWDELKKYFGLYKSSFKSGGDLTSINIDDPSVLRQTFISRGTL